MSAVFTEIHGNHEKHKQKNLKQTFSRSKLPSQTMLTEETPGS